MTLSPTNSRWSSLVFLCARAFVSCIFVSPFKKTKKLHLDFFLYALHFLHPIHCISFSKFLAKLTHVGRWTRIPSGAPNSWWATSTLSNPHKFNYMTKINTTTQGMLFHLREALPQDMGQSSSTRCEYIKMLKQKMVTPFLSLNDEYDLQSSVLTWFLSQYTLT